MGFTPTYLDSEEYYKQDNRDQRNINAFSPSQKSATPMLTGYNNPYSTDLTGNYYPLNNQALQGNQPVSYTHLTLPTILRV